MTDSPHINAWRKPLAALCASQFLAMLAMSQFMPFLTLYVQQLGVVDPARAARWSGFLLGAGFLAAGLMAPLWGMLADRVGKKKMVLRAMAGSGVAVGLMSWAGSVWDLLALRILQGTLGGFVSSTTALVAAVVPKERIGTAVGALQSSFMAGLIAGPLAGGLLLDALGFHWMILGSAVFMALGAALIAWGVPAPDAVPIAKPASVTENVRLVLASPTLRSASLVQFLVQAAFVAMHPVMVLFTELLAPGQGLAARHTGAVFGVTAAATLVGAAYWGPRVDKIGAPFVLSLSLALCAVLYVPQAMATDLPVFLMLRLLLGFFIGGIQPSLHGLIIRTAPEERRAGVLGVTFSGSLFGNAIGPVLGGMVAAHLGPRAPFFVVALVLAAAWAVARRFLPRVDPPSAMNYDKAP